jgi:hypothetical protein
VDLHSAETSRSKSEFQLSLKRVWRKVVP